MTSDIIIIILFVLFVIMGIWRGAARTLLNLAAVIICSAVSDFLANAAANWIYSSFIKASVVQKVEGLVSAGGGEYAAKNSLTALPDLIRGPFAFMARLFGTTPEQLQGRLIGSTKDTSSLVSTIEKPLGDICVLFISMLISAVLFIILIILMKKLINKIMVVFRIPVIKQINAILGAVIGAAEGAVIIVVLVNVLYVMLSWFNPTALSNTSMFGTVFNALAIFK